MERIPTWRLECLIEVDAEDAEWALERLHMVIREVRGLTLRRAAVATPATTDEADAQSPLLALGREWAAREAARERGGSTG